MGRGSGDFSSAFSSLAARSICRLLASAVGPVFRRAAPHPQAILAQGFQRRTILAQPTRGPPINVWLPPLPAVGVPYIKLFSHTIRSRSYFTIGLADTVLILRTNIHVLKFKISSFSGFGGREINV